MIDKIIKEVEEYGMLKGIPVNNHNGADYYISVTDIKKILEGHREEHETVDSYVKSLDKPAVYIRTLYREDLYRNRDCRLFYVYSRGDIKDIRELAAAKNITLVKLSKEDFEYYRKIGGK